MTRRVWALAALISTGCVGVKKGELEELKPAVEAFYQRVRWKDFRGAGDLIIAEKRDAFVKARSKDHDERDLFITNFELEDAKVAPDTLSASAVATLSWYRLPSTTEETATITNLFVWRDGAWQLESQDEGPFPELRPAPPPAR